MATNEPGVTALTADATKFATAVVPHAIDANGTAVPQSSTAPAPVSGVPRLIAAVGTVLTRAANTTAYSVGDSVSDSATIGSVTALPVTLSDVNDAPVTLDRIHVTTADTGPGAASATWEIYIYNSDPTANSGVQGGDNTAFSNKRAGLLGRMIGTWIAMQDGSFLEAVPVAGSRIISPPGTGAKTVWLQYKTDTAFTSSAISLTYTPTVEGFQGRA